MFTGIGHREDEGIVGDVDVSKGVAGAKEKLSEAIYILATFNAILNPPYERRVADQDGKGGIATEL
jgi:hypothetical protein